MDIYPDLPGELQVQVYRGLSPVTRRALSPNWDPRKFSLTQEDILQTLNWDTLARLFVRRPSPTILEVNGEYLDSNTIQGIVHGVCRGLYQDDYPFEYKFVQHLYPYSSKGMLTYQHPFYENRYSIIGVYEHRNSKIYMSRFYQTGDLTDTKMYYQLSNDYYLDIGYQHFVNQTLSISIYNISRPSYPERALSGKCGQIRYIFYLPKGDTALRMYRSNISEVMEWYSAWIERVLPWPIKPILLTSIDSRCFRDVLKIPFGTMYPITQAFRDTFFGS